MQKKIKAIIKEKLPSETGDLLLAILLGDKKDLSEQIQINFKIAIYHICLQFLGLMFLTLL